MDTFQEKVVVVTGASRGIGQAICTAFAARGATVVGVARGDQSATAQGVSGHGSRFVTVASDLGALSQADAHALVADILRQTGRIDVWVNNAGIIRRAPAVDFSEKDWGEVLHTNLTAPFFLCQAVARWWLDGGREESAASTRLKLINIASLLTFQGGITVPAYAASKHGIAGVTKALANEWARERINVNALAPGYIATDNTQALRDDPVRNRAIQDRIPEGRWGEPDDIALAICYLAAPASDYVNGAILNVDGGWLAR